MTSIDLAARHERLAARFADLIDNVTDWDAPTPVKEWNARDIVDHLTMWLPSFLSAVDVKLPEGPSVVDDPAGAFAAQTAGVQALLEDPATADVIYSGAGPDQPLPAVLNQFYLADLFMHAWDLARATGQDDTLDAELLAESWPAMEAADEMLRASGQFGPRVPVADDATPQEQFIAFIGRDPHWAPES